METIIQLIFLISLLKYCLKAALSNNLWLIVGYGALLASLAFALYPVVITQPMTIIGDMLTSREVVGNMALLTTAESISGILISIYLLDNYFKPKSKRTKWAKLLKIVPGAIVLFGVGYFELLFFKWRVGGEFMETALLYSATLLVGVVSVALLLRWLLEGESLKLEVKLLSNLLILTLGLLVSSSVAEYSASNATAKIEWDALIAVLGCFATFALLGVWLHKTKFSNKREF